jgi:membrane dipeptidase
MPVIKPPSDEAIRIQNETPVIDIHCHPTLKVKLFNYKIYNYKHNFADLFSGDPSPDDTPFQMQYDLPKMRYGGVDGIWSSVYVVERGLIENSSILNVGFWAVELLNLQFKQAVEESTLLSSSAFNKAIEVINIMEQQVRRAQEKNFKVKYAYSAYDFENTIKSGELCLLHSLEGCHMLGRDYDSLNKYMENLEYMFNRGVCSITLGHFMPNNICYPPQGISPHTRNSIGFDYDYSQFLSKGLTEVGKSVVTRMLELGIVVDLNHVTPAGRKDVYKINEDRGSKKRPLIFSHNGIRQNCTGEVITPDEDEIKIIQKCGGIIGVIFMNYWLVKTEDKPDFGINNIVKTIKDIAAICGGSYENIAIGSDMDGFTNPVDDLYSAEHMPRLTQAMLDAGIKEDDIKKVLGLNVIRVLKEGWGK